MDAKIGTCWRCGNMERVTCTRCHMAKYCSKACLYDDKFRHKVECDSALKIRKCDTCQKPSSEVKQCSSCLQKWYCGSECQKKAWPSHGGECRITQKDIVEMAEMLKQVHWRRNVSDGPLSTVGLYYWGNTPAVDLLNLKHNEWRGDDRQDRFNLLLCAVGDLRYVLKTSVSLPDEFSGQVDFYLSDINPHIQARNVLILYLLFTCDNVISMADMIVQIWYSVCLTQSCWKMLESRLEELVNSDAERISGITDGKLVICSANMDALKEVWQAWLTVGRAGGATFHISKQREMLIYKEQGGWVNYINGVPLYHRLSLDEWWKGGILLSCTNPQRANAKVQNVTLLRYNKHGRKDKSNPTKISDGCADLPSDWPAVLRREPMVYAIPTHAFPFLSWDYVDARSYCDVPSLITMYNNYISHIVEEFGIKLKKGLLSFRIFLGDCFELAHEIQPNIKFDRISTSNIADYYGLPVVLDFAKGLLNTNNPNSVIITELMNWNFIRGTSNTPSSSNNVNILGIIQDTGVPQNDIGFYEVPKTWESYEDNNDRFIKYLRADFMIHKVNKSNAQAAEHKAIPRYHVDVMKYGDLKLHDFLLNLNRVIPHRWDLTRRRVTQLSGYERNLEWTIPTNTPECKVS